MRITHVSVLNPIDHTRIIKFSKTQIEMGHVITVVGKFSNPPIFQNPNFHYFSTGNIQRNLINRFKTHFKILFWWLKNVSQTDIFWIHTPELFWLFSLNFLLRKKQVYDVHENYFENIYSAKYYSVWLRKPLAYFVRLLEKFIAKISYVVYSEYAYENILNTKNYEMIPNAFDTDLIPKNTSSFNSNFVKFVISGNLSEEWGVINAIDFWEKQNQFYPAFLTIIGYSSLSEFSKKIRLRIQNSPYKSLCQLIGIEKYVPYTEILKAINESDFVLAPYQIQPKFFYKIPTKFYEAMALKKTLLFSNIPYWNELNEKYSFGFCIKNWTDYWEIKQADFQNIPNDFYDWKSQTPKIQKIINNL